MSTVSKSKSKDKKAGKEQKTPSKSSASVNAGTGLPASAYNPLLGTFHTLETSSTYLAPTLHVNGRFRNIDDSDDHSGSYGSGGDYDSASNNDSRSVESEEHNKEKSLKQEVIPGADNDKREKIRQKNERKHQRQKERRAQELHERCSGYLMSRKLEALAQQLVSMGFSHERATMALILNEGRVEEAVAWLFEGGEDADKHKDQNLDTDCKSGIIHDARQMLDKMPERNSVSWATMISGYATRGMAGEAVGVFKLILQDEEESNPFFFTSVLSALTLPELINAGSEVHCVAVKTGVIQIAEVRNALVTMYLKCGSPDNALQMFALSTIKNSIMWSAMVTGFAQSGDSKKALELFSRMHHSGVSPSEYTFVGVINACSDIGATQEGRQVHSYSVKMGFENQMYIVTALVDMYAKSGSISDARKGFDCLLEPDVVLWTSMIGGYIQHGDNEEALSLYGRMEAEGIPPNDLTIASVLKGCSSLAALEQGKQIHARAIKYGLAGEITIGSSLSSMYAKCGCIDEGNMVFRRMTTRDIVSWNAMISGLAQNGCSDEALELFEEMRSEGVKPDNVTFVNVLSACSHIGLVERAWEYFKMISTEFELVPGLEHYTCMVDAYSRAGRLIEAKEFIESATLDHGMCLWRILLSACRNHRHYELGAYAGEKLMELGSQESSAYVLLSRIYTALGRSDDVGRIMRLMKLRRVGKEPGCSWIELKNLVHVFVVGDQKHPEIADISSWLRILTKQMMDEGYQPGHDSFLTTST